MTIRKINYAGVVLEKQVERRELGVSRELHKQPRLDVDVSFKVEMRLMMVRGGAGAKLECHQKSRVIALKLCQPALRLPLNERPAGNK